MQKQDLIPSVAMAAYGGIGLLFGLFATGLFYEACRDAGQIDPNQFLFEATVLNCLNVGRLLPILASVLLFLVVLVSLQLPPRGRLIEVIFPIFAFTIMVSLWFFKDLVFHGKLGWTGFLHAVSLGGIGAMSLGTTLDHRRIHNEIKSMFGDSLSDIDDKKIALKRLELEHNYIQASLQWIVMGTIVFLTAVVAGYYYSPIGYQSGDPIIGTRLLILFVGALWAIFGIFFGMVFPNMRTMQYLREKTHKLLSKSSIQDDQGKGKKRKKEREELEERIRKLEEEVEKLKTQLKQQD